MKLRIGSLLCLMLLLIAVIGMTTSCSVPQAAEDQQIEKNDAVSDNSNLTAKDKWVSQGVNIRCKWDARTGEPAFLLAKIVNGQWRLTYGPIRGDAENNVAYLTRQWQIISYNYGGYFIRCLDPRLTGDGYTRYLAGGYYIQNSDDENDEDIAFAFMATLRAVHTSENGNINTGYYYPPYTSCWPESDRNSNEMLVWGYDENSFDSGDYTYLTMSTGYDYSNTYSSFVGVLNVESTMKDNPVWVNGCPSAIQLGFDGGNGLYPGSWAWTGYWSNKWVITQSAY